MGFAENLKMIKEASNMSNYKFAQFIGCSQTSVANWLSGERLPHKKARVVIADAFGLTLEQMDGTLPDNYKEIILKKEEPATVSGSGLDDEMIQFFTMLTPDELEKVFAFAQGLVANRESKVSPRK